MNRDELLKMHDETCVNARVTMEKKNQDYTGSTNDVFANFRITQFIGVEPELGILMRVSDKIQRLATFINKGELKVQNESAADAIEDIINYVILLKGMIQDKSKVRPLADDKIRIADECEFAHLRGDADGDPEGAEVFNKRSVPDEDHGFYVESNWPPDTDDIGQH
jgi:hypothetical protein